MSELGAGGENGQKSDKAAARRKRSRFLDPIAGGPKWANHVEVAIIGNYAIEDCTVFMLCPYTSCASTCWVEDATA